MGLPRGRAEPHQVLLTCPVHPKSMGSLFLGAGRAEPQHPNCGVPLWGGVMLVGAMGPLFFWGDAGINTGPHPCKVMAQWDPFLVGCCEMGKWDPGPAG